MFIFQSFLKNLLPYRQKKGEIYAFLKCLSLHFAIICIHCLFSYCLFICSFLVTLNLEVRKPHALQTLIQI